MESSTFSVVTGAYVYTGKYITRLLLARGERVANLTNHPDRPNEFGDRVRSLPMCFDDPQALTASLRGVDTLGAFHSSSFPVPDAIVYSLSSWKTRLDLPSTPGRVRTTSLWMRWVRRFSRLTNS